MTFEEQAVRAFENLRPVVEAAGAKMSDVAKVTVYLNAWSHIHELNRIYPRFFPEPFPARTPVRMETPLGEILVDAVAILPEEEQ